MPQQALNPPNPYNRSGGMLLLNPTDREVKRAYRRTAAQLRTAEAIRGTPPTYTVADPAALTSVTPANGPAAGGTAVTLAGTGFTDATGVTFDGIAATSFVVVSPTSITCVTPAHAAGLVNVIVGDIDGSGTQVGGYNYT